MTAYWLRTYSAVFLGAILLSFGFGFLCRWLGSRLNLVDQPSERKVHQWAVPRIGGIGMCIAFALPITLTRYYSYALEGMVIGGVMMMCIGALDDLRGGISAILKLLALIIATIILMQFGVILSITGIPVLDAVLTILWVVGMTAALNAVDNMNGQAAGISTIAAVCFFIVAVETRDWFMGMVAVSLAGSCLGFLPHNFPRGRLFMGDSGAFFLGYVLAAMGVQGQWSADPLVAWIIPLLILAVPIFDLTYVVLQRYFSGVTKTLRESITHCAKDHLSHRLVSLGLSQVKAVLVIYLISLCLAMGGILLRHSASRVDCFIHIAQGTLILFLISLLMWLGRSRNKEPEPAPLPRKEPLHSPAHSLPAVKTTSDKVASQPGG